MQGRCHPGAPTHTVYDKHSGVMEIRCAECRTLIAQVLVAPSDHAIHMSAGEAQHLRAWQAEHKTVCPCREDVGAIGGQYTYELTPTSLGAIVKMRCACGAHVDATRYDEW